MPDEMSIERLAALLLEGPADAKDKRLVCAYCGKASGPVDTHFGRVCGNPECLKIWLSAHDVDTKDLKPADGK